MIIYTKEIFDKYFNPSFIEFVKSSMKESSIEKIINFEMLNVNNENVLNIYEKFIYHLINLLNSIKKIEEQK